MIYVVGVGPGNPELITKKAVDIFEESEIIIGGKRNIELYQRICKNFKNEEYSKKFFYLESNFSMLNSFIKENINKQITVLASGDPKVYGISDYIIRNFSDYTKVEVISGISSIQYAFSKLEINMNDLYITSSHGRNPDFDFIFSHDKIAMVTDKKVGAREICKEIISRNLKYNVYICEKLSYDDEKIYCGEASDFIDSKTYDLAVVILVKM